MNTMNNALSVKVWVCAAVAVALTVVLSWGFVASTSKIDAPYSATSSLGEVLITASR